jgi:hypothetical protein
MRRLVEIESEYSAHKRRLEEEYRALEEESDGRVESFAEHWLATARAWRFDELNGLIREHNAWYPIESNLPMDPRTHDFVGVRGDSYRRVELGPEWILEHFPPDPASRAGRPRPPLRVPREPLPARQRPSSRA